MRNELIGCMKRGEMVEIIYMSAEKSFSKRRVQVQQIGSDRMYAFCHLRQAYRTFHFDRILALFPVVYREKAVVHT